MTGLLESGVRKPFICLGPTTEVSAHSAGHEEVPRVWPFNATEKLDPDVRELLSMHCSWCVLDYGEAQLRYRTEATNASAKAVVRRNCIGQQLIPVDTRIDMGRDSRLVSVSGAPLPVAGRERIWLLFDGWRPMMPFHSKVKAATLCPTKFLRITGHLSDAKRLTDGVATHVQRQNISQHRDACSNKLCTVHSARRAE
jgi:hypothetical protein